MQSWLQTRLQPFSTLILFSLLLDEAGLFVTLAALALRLSL